jgi:hypothetical protein
MLEFAQRHHTIHGWYKVIFSNETKINWVWCNARAWCWVRGGESQLQAYHVSQIIRHVGGAIYVWSCMTSDGIGYMCKIEKKMTQALYLSILQDGVTKTIEWYCFSPSRVIFQRGNDPNNTSIFNHAVVVNAKFWHTYLASSTTWPTSNGACVGTCGMGNRRVSNTTQRNASIVGLYANIFPFHQSRTMSVSKVLSETCPIYPSCFTFQRGLTNHWSMYKYSFNIEPMYIVLFKSFFLRV